MAPSDQKAESCRYCSRPLDPADKLHATYWPFCSARCRMAELGAWFDERYVVSRPVDQVADDAAPPDGTQGEKEGPQHSE